MKIAKGEKPERRDCGKLSGERVTGDHKTTIFTFISLFKDTDILQSNHVENKVVYEWLMELRNQINYRERTFTEPVNKYFFSSLFDRGKIKNQIETYLSDELFVYCFDIDHCSLAAPLKLAAIVREQLFNFIDFEPMTSAQITAIDKLLIDSNLHKSKAFRPLYDFNRR